MLTASHGASQVVLVVKNLLANAGDARDVGLISGSGRSPGGGHATHSSSLAWRIPWTEEAGGLQSMQLQRVGCDLAAKPPPPPHRDLYMKPKGLYL